MNVSNVTSHLIAKLEEKYGRLQPTVTREDMINSPGQLSIILHKIYSSDHFRYRYLELVILILKLSNTRHESKFVCNIFFHGLFFTEKALKMPSWKTCWPLNMFKVLISFRKIVWFLFQFFSLVKKFKFLIYSSLIGNIWQWLKIFESCIRCLKFCSPC